MRWVRLLALFVLISVASNVSSQELSALRPGHWVEIRGEWTGRREFSGTKVSLVEPDDLEELIGTIERHPTNSDYFVILGQEVHTSNRTKWKELELGNLDGRRAKVEGTLKGPRNFSARRVSARGRGRDRLLGRLDFIQELPNGAWELSVLGYRVLVSSEQSLTLKVPLEDYALTVARFDPTASRWVSEDDSLGAGYRIAKNLFLTGLASWSTSLEENFDVDLNSEQDRENHGGSLLMRLTWTPHEDVTGVVTGRGNWRYRLDDQDGNHTTSDYSLAESFVYWRDVAGSSLDIALGRQDFDDPREWVFDQNLDALRFYWRRPKWGLDVSASTTLADGGTRDEAAENYIAVLNNARDDRWLAAYVVHRDFEPEFSDRSTHVGLQAFGDWIPQTNSWCEFAYLDADRQGRPVGAWGLDIGSTWLPPAAEPFYFTAGVAIGSGDSNPSSGTDRGFEQTGLQDNNGRLGGVTSFRLYGELVDPELKNLEVYTLGVGTKFSKRSSLDLVLHHYRQNEAFPRWSGSEIGARPNGVDRDLGWEFDAILGLRQFENFDIEMVAGYFEPGAAFDGAERAIFGKFQVRYRF